MRWDEIGWDTYNPAALMDVRAGIDSRGNLVAIDFTNIMPQWGGTAALAELGVGGCKPPLGHQLVGLPAGIDVQPPQPALHGERRSRSPATGSPGATCGRYRRTT